MPIRTALLGYGLSGAYFHAPFLKTNPHYQLTTILSSREIEIRKNFPDVKIVSDPEKIWSDPEIELVIITTPNTSHYPLAKSAILAAKDVVVEKPFTPDYQQASELVTLAEHNGRILTVYHNRRWDSDFLTLKKVIQSGQLGEIKQFESHFDRFRPTVNDRWREKDLPGSGLLFDLGSHLLDQSLHLFGEPDWILGDVAAQRPQAETDDYFHLLLGYGKMRVLLHASCFAKEKTPRFVIHGSQGSFVKYGLDPQEDCLRSEQLPEGPTWGAEAAEIAGLLTNAAGQVTITSQQGNYHTFFNELATAIKNRTIPPVTASEGANVIRGLELVKTNPLTKIEW